MVGVPGRSQSCKTCKKRKIACTLERPGCRICIKSNRECLGYEKERKFILDDRTRKQNLKSDSSVVPHETPCNTIVTETNAPGNEQLQGSVPTSNAYTWLWKISCPSTRSVYREQIISEFLYSFTPNPTGILKELPSKSGGTARSWFTLLPTHPNFTTALEATVLAVCTSRLGRLHNDPALVHESLKFYIRGLWELQKALYTPDLMYREETAASVMALAYYEVLECPDQTTKAWLKHIHGCSKLFEIRGPKAYSTKFGHEIFLAFRQIEIQQAISEKRRTFLSEPEWNTYPWKGYTKPIAQFLLDLQAEMASLLATGLTLLSSLPLAPDPIAEHMIPLIPEVISLVQQCWKLDTRLNGFYKRLESSTSGPLYWAQMSNGFNRSILDEVADSEGRKVGEIFPVAFQFENLKIARTCMNLWATQAILWSGMNFVYDLLGAVIPPSAMAQMGLPAMDERMDPGAVAKSICQSMEYWGGQNLESGVVLAIFPLKVAVETLGDVVEGSGKDKREFKWAKTLMHKIGASGVRLLKHLDGGAEQHAYIPVPVSGRSH